MRVALCTGPLHAHPGCICACCSLNRYHYGGIACCVVGITLVGVSSMLSGARAAWQMAALAKAHCIGDARYLALLCLRPAAASGAALLACTTFCLCAGEGSASHPVTKEAMLTGMGLIIARSAKTMSAD